MAHMLGAEPFYCPNPWGVSFRGASQVSLPYVVLEPPKSVLT